MLPKEYGSGFTCHRRFQEWTVSKVFQRLWIRLLEVYDDLRHWMEMAIAWQYICKSAFRGDSTGPNPTDIGNIGTKRHVLTDQDGIPLSVIITSATTHDMKAVKDTLNNVIVQRPSCKQNLCLDKAYDFSEIKRIYQKEIYPIYTSQRRRKRIDKDRISNKAMGCRKNKLMAQQIQKVISKVQKEIVELSFIGASSLLYHHM